MAFGGWQGLKPISILWTLSARLKRCPSYKALFRKVCLKLILTTEVFPCYKALFRKVCLKLIGTTEVLPCYKASFRWACD